MAWQAYTHLLSKEQMAPKGARVNTVSGAQFWPDTAVTTHWSLVGTRISSRALRSDTSMRTPASGGSAGGSRRRLQSAEELASAGYLRSSVTRDEPPEGHKQEMRQKAKRAHKKEDADCSNLSLPIECEGPKCVSALSARARECPALLPAIESWLTARCTRKGSSGCGYMLNVLGMVGTPEAEVSAA